MLQIHSHFSPDSMYLELLMLKIRDHVKASHDLSGKKIKLHIFEMPKSPKSGDFPIWAEEEKDTTCIYLYAIDPESTLSPAYLSFVDEPRYCRVFRSESIREKSCKMNEYAAIFAIWITCIIDTSEAQLKEQFGNHPIKHILDLSTDEQVIVACLKALISRVLNGGEKCTAYNAPLPNSIKGSEIATLVAAFNTLVT